MNAKNKTQSRQKTSKNAVGLRIIFGSATKAALANLDLGVLDMLIVFLYIVIKGFVSKTWLTSSNRIYDFLGR